MYLRQSVCFTDSDPISKSVLACLNHERVLWLILSSSQYWEKQLYHLLPCLCVKEKVQGLSKDLARVVCLAG